MYLYIYLWVYLQIDEYIGRWHGNSSETFYLALNPRGVNVKFKKRIISNLFEYIGSNLVTLSRRILDIQSQKSTFIHVPYNFFVFPLLKKSVY